MGGVTDCKIFRLWARAKVRVNPFCATILMEGKGAIESLLSFVVGKGIMYVVIMTHLHCCLTVSMGVMMRSWRRVESEHFINSVVIHLSYYCISNIIFSD